MPQSPMSQNLNYRLNSSVGIIMSQLILVRLRGSKSQPNILNGFERLNRNCHVVCRANSTLDCPIKVKDMT